MRHAIAPFLLVTAVAAVSALAACGSDHSDLLTGSTGGNPGGSCKQSSDCGDTTPVCDPTTASCVQCLFESQCPQDHACTNHVCVAITTCSSSLDCAKLTGTSICDPESKSCVQCVSATDCGGDKICVNHSCKELIACESDNQCTPLGKLCDKVAGMCVDCLSNDQCPEISNCKSGTCTPDICEAGSSKCQGNAVVLCSSDGAQWGASTPCSSQTSCQTSGGVAQCAPWLCQPGSIACQGDELITCAADGMSIVSTVDCAAQSMKCIGNACSSLTCVPNAKFCSGADLRQCNAQGTDSLLVMTCDPGQFCDNATTSCQNLVCTPAQPVCLGTVATTCNASGTGYTPGGTDCAAQGKACNAGLCQGCPGGGGPPDSVRIVEVFIGNSDYIVLENRGACPAELDPLHLQIGAVDAANNLDFDIPPRVLAAGEKVYVADATGAKAEDISVPDNIFLTPDTGEYILLCNGPCASGVALDYFAHASGAQPPLPPLGITFTPAPVTGITLATAEQDAYVRVQFAGNFPSFKAADWQVGACSRPWVNSPQCPSSAPASGGTCSQANLMCIYGAVQCSCLNPFGWICQ